MPKRERTTDRPKKNYVLYRDGVRDAVNLMSRLMLNEIFSNDPRANKQEIEEKVKYLQNKILELIKRD